MAVYSDIVLSGEQAIAWEQNRGWNQAGACLNTVWQAYGSYQSVGPHAGQYPNAIDGWNYAEQQHPGDWDPPRGVPVYLAAVDGPRWGGDVTYAAGDVCLSLGGGQLLATDWPSNGQIGVCSIQQRCNQTARPYLGWCGDFLGYQVAEGTPATPPEIGDTMNGMLYFYTANDAPDGERVLHALAGSGTGTAAWLEISDIGLASAIAANTKSGNAIWLAQATWNDWRSRYLDGSSDDDQQ